MPDKCILLFVILAVFMVNCNARKDQLVIFHAGSLSVPFSEIIEDYQAEYPGVKVLKEIAGSRTCARKITDLKKKCDIMASADFTVIDALLIPDYADWNVKFATNEMALVYHETSRRADEVNNRNWPEILLDKEVHYGRADPDSDPCGYRTVLAAKLAEEYYSMPGFAETLLAKNREYIRPKEVDLLALLEVGEIDYIFLYRSVAQQHNLLFVQLPYEVNLGSEEQRLNYSRVQVEISGSKPGETITKIGAPMVYGVTIPDNPPNSKNAENFIRFLLDKNRGLAVMERNGQPPVWPPLSHTYDKLPAFLKEVAGEG